MARGSNNRGATPRRIPRQEGPQRSEDSARLDDGCWEFRTEPNLLHELTCPSAAERVNELGCCRVREFADGISSQPVIEEVRDRNQLLGCRNDAGRLSQRSEELVDRIDGHELNACRRVDLFLCYSLKYVCHYVLGAA